MTGFHLPVERLSATSLADAATCPERWRRERLHGEWSHLSLDAFIGRVHHRALGMSLSHKLEREELAPAERIYNYAWADEVDDEEPEWTEHPEKVTELGLKMLASAQETLLPVIEPLAIEGWFEERIPGVPVPVVGSIDTVAKGVNWEFKTAGQKVSKPKAKWRFQGRIYQLASPLPVNWGVTTKQVTPYTYSPITLDKDSKLPPLMIDVGNPDATVRMIQQTVWLLDDFYARFGADSPWPMTGLMHDYACEYCSFGPRNPMPSCPAWKS